MNDPANMTQPAPEWSRIADIMEKVAMPWPVRLALAQWFTECRSHLPPPLGWQEVSELRRLVETLEHRLAGYVKSEAEAWKQYGEAERKLEALRREAQENSGSIKAPLPCVIVVVPDSKGMFTERQVRDLVAGLNNAGRSK